MAGGLFGVGESVSLHRRNAKRDANEQEIVDMLEVCGWSVLRISVPNGPDLIAAKDGACAVFDGYGCDRLSRTVAVEVKTGKKKLRDGQQRWFDNWPGEKAVLRCAEDVKDL